MKLIKLGLASALIAGYGVSAKSLKEAIDKVEVSGFVKYEMSKRVSEWGLSNSGNDAKLKKSANEASDQIDFEVEFKVPTGKESEFVVSIEDDNPANDGVEDFSRADIENAVHDSQNPRFVINNMYFKTKANDDLTLAFGMFDNLDTGFIRDEGAQAYYDMGLLTLGAHYYYNSQFGSNDEAGIEIRDLKIGSSDLYLSVNRGIDTNKDIAQDKSFNSNELSNNADEGYTELRAGISMPVGPLAISLKHFVKSYREDKDVNGKKHSTGGESALNIAYKANGFKAKFIAMYIGALGGVTDDEMGIDMDGEYDRATTNASIEADALAGGYALNVALAYKLPYVTPSVSYTLKAIGDDARALNKDYTNDQDFRVAFSHTFDKIKTSAYYHVSTGVVPDGEDDYKQSGIILSYKF